MEYHHDLSPTIILGQLTFLCFSIIILDDFSTEPHLLLEIPAREPDLRRSSERSQGAKPPRQLRICVICEICER
jgi:hypothetical protein